MNNINIESINPAKPSFEYIKLEIAFAHAIESTIPINDRMRVTSSVNKPFINLCASDIHHEESQIDGIAFHQTLTCISAPNYVTALGLKTSTRYRFIARLTDNNGIHYIIGTKESPLKMSITNRNSGPESGTVMDLKLEADTLEPIMIEE